MDAQAAVQQQHNECVKKENKKKRWRDYKPKRTHNQSQQEQQLLNAQRSCLDTSLMEGQISNPLEERTGNTFLSCNVLDEFPLIGEKCKHKGQNHLTASNLIPVTQTPQLHACHKPKRDHPIKIEISTLLQQQQPAPYLLPEVNETPKQLYTGNQLDSSQPERKEGKHRDVPKKKRLSKLKNQILQNQSELEKIDLTSKEPLPYCDNEVTPQLNGAVRNFVAKVVLLQTNLYKKDQAKARMKKRYVLGFHETKRGLVSHKIKVLVIATNLQIYTREDALFQIITELVNIAKTNNIMYIFALKRTVIGNLAHKNRAICCIGITNFEGAEIEFSAVKNILNDLSENMKADGANGNEVQEVNTNFLEGLKETLCG